MVIDLKDIKKIRIKLGLTQKELARNSGVSQSLIAKIEAGLIDPTYTKAKKIINSLETINLGYEKTVEQVMKRKIVSCKSDGSIKEAILKMRNYSVSQIPIIEENICLGIVSESDILKSVINGKEKLLKEIMEDCPPIVTKKTRLSVVSELLKFYSLILVGESGELLGVVTKSDLLSEM